MAMVTVSSCSLSSSSVITEDVTDEIHSNNLEERLIDDNDELISTSDVSLQYNAGKETSIEVNIQDNLKEIRSDVESSTNNNCHSNKQTHERESFVILNSNTHNEIDFNESNKYNEGKINEEHCDEHDKNKKDEKISSNNFLDLVDDNDDSEEERNLFETSNKESLAVSNDYYTENDNNSKKIFSKHDVQKENDLCKGIDKTIRTSNSNYHTLIDSESEEEKEDEMIHNPVTVSGNKNKKSTEQIAKIRKMSIRSSKNEAMRLIHSETQRLLRETEISLPYHKPKQQRTLQEFLNRKKVSAALPKAPSIAAKLKMSSAIVSQVLAEKEKEAELFYKSSDSENDMEEISYENVRRCSIVNENAFPLVDIKNTRKVEEDIQDSSNIREIIQDCSDTVAKESVINKSYSTNQQDKNLSSISIENSYDETNVLVSQIMKKHKQQQQNLQSVNVSRKLFDTSNTHESKAEDRINCDRLEQSKIEKDMIILLDNEKFIGDKNDKSERYRSTIDYTSDDASCSYDFYATSGIVIDHDLTVEKAMHVSEPCCIKDKQIDVVEIDNCISDNAVRLDLSANCNCACTDVDGMRKNTSTDIDKTSSLSLLSSNIQTMSQNNSITDKYDSSPVFDPMENTQDFTDKVLFDRNKLLLNRVSTNPKVTLKGSPGMIIDLTDTAKSNGRGVNKLLDRFFCKHVSTNKQLSENTTFEIAMIKDTENGMKETLPYNLSIVNGDMELNNKPGAKLMRLKEDLKLQMALKRDKEWQSKKKELLQTQECKEEGANRDIYCDLDEQEEEDCLDSDNSEESEPEENDVYIKDKKMKRCFFADDEAEVTDDENSSSASANNIEESENDVDEMECLPHYDEESRSVSSTCERKKKYDDDDNHNDDDLSETEIEQTKEDLDGENIDDIQCKDNNIVCENIIGIDMTVDKHRKMKQSVQEFRNDSNVGCFNDLENRRFIANIKQTFETISGDDEKNNVCISEYEESMPAFQQDVTTISQTPCCKTPSSMPRTSMLDNLVSPITQLSILNSSLDSNRKDSSAKRREYSLDKDESVFIKNTRNDLNRTSEYNIRSENTISKKLFVDDVITEPIDNNDYLVPLYSNKFESTSRTNLNCLKLSQLSQSDTSESQLLELCSGNFNTKLVNTNIQLEIGDKFSQDIRLTLDESSNISVSKGNTEEVLKKAKHVNTVNSKLKLRITSSSDEESESNDTFLKFKRRLRKLSDSENDDIQSSNDDNGDDDMNNEEQYVDYDSEENEVIAVPKKDIKKVAANFLEEEAELSGSDWESDDEDEKDLDKLEFEEADDEHIDEEKVKQQLGKMHMKQVLDEDNRQVRLLKELLFEDGDLHADGNGRERRFKWKNIGNNIDSTNTTTQLSEENDVQWIDVQEDEEEAKWNKLRQERDKFLEARKNSSNEIVKDELNDTQVFKFGVEATLKKNKSIESTKQDNIVDSAIDDMEPIVPRCITDLLNTRPDTGKKSQTIYNVLKRRSLLTRGKESLARIASLAKQGDPAISHHAVNTRNFVFQYIDPYIKNTASKAEDETKQESNSHLLNKSRKRKMASNFTLPKKKPMTEDSRKRKK